MKILVSNVGSTSLKFKLYDMPEEKVLCTAKVERVGSCDNAIFSYRNEQTGDGFSADKLCVESYTAGIRMFLEKMTDGKLGVVASVNEIEAVGFKTVLSKGYYGVHFLTEEVLQGMRDYLYIAPAHNAPYLEAIEQFKMILPDVAMVGVFETAFHVTVPKERRIYALPYEWYEEYGIQRMGYHGASHSYIAEEAPKYGKAERIISCHLGGSCSLCAVLNGESVDTSFGFSLQTGIPHANRCGDIDPYIVPFLLNQGMSEDEVMKGLSKNGGLLGVSGVSNDLRLVQQAAEAGNERAQLAIDIFVNAIIRYIGMFYAELGGLDSLVFTGGIGENSVMLRQRVCSELKHLGIVLDEEKNRERREGDISAEDSKVRVLVIPANEELGIARKTFRCIED